MPGIFDTLRQRPAVRSLMDLKAQNQTLLHQMLAMAREDVAILGAAARSPDAQMMAQAGSPNDLLWSAMQRLGWMTSRDRNAAPGGQDRLSRFYRITPGGSQPIAALMTAYAGERLRVDARMIAIANGLCREFTDQLTRRVQADGGSLGDVSVLLALVFEGIIARSVRPDDRKRCAIGLLDDMQRMITARVEPRTACA